jgi:UDP-N-acetyl-D-glucosamine dehydrogenase
VAYKQNNNDVRESPALDIIMLLRQWGVEISYHDSHVPGLHVEGADMEMKSVDLTEDMLGNQDCVVIVTPHSGLDYQKIVKFSPLIMDTRNALKGSKAPHIIRL